ncbi:hypothetical protein [Cytophaga sp. FL35]|nr:hypothetical protein [Cytophaga sp. FL35]
MKNSPDQMTYSFLEALSELGSVLVPEKIYTSENLKKEAFMKDEK